MLGDDTQRVNLHKVFSPHILKAGDSNPAIPFYIFGIGGVLGALCLPWMPETADEKLPDTVEQAEEFGKGQTLFPIPILNRRKKLSDIESTK